MSIMETFSVVEHNAVVQRRGIPTPLPGLALIDLEEAGYSLTHVRSGLAIIFADSPEALALAALDLAPVDWTLDARSIKSDPVAVEAFTAARRRPGVNTNSMTGAPVDIAERNA